MSDHSACGIIVTEAVYRSHHQLNTRDLLFGVGYGALTVVALAFLPPPLRLDATAILLAVIAAIYVGFAIADGRRRVLQIEVGAALAFTLLTFGGLWAVPGLLVVGYFAHGLWDVLHRPTLIDTTVARWYPPLCLGYNWVVGAYLVWWLWL